MERIWWHLRSVIPSLNKYLQLYNYQIIYNSHTNACNTYFLHYLKIWFVDRHLFFKRRAKKIAIRLYTCKICIEHAVSTGTYLCWLRGYRHKALGTEIPQSCGAEVSGSHFGRRWLKISFNFLTAKTSNQPQMSASLQEYDIFYLSQNNFPMHEWF